MRSRPSNLVDVSKILTPKQIEHLNFVCAEEAKKYDDPRGPELYFGKHKGKHAAECPRSYIVWMHDNAAHGFFKRQLAAWLLKTR